MNVSLTQLVAAMRTLVVIVVATMTSTLLLRLLLRRRRPPLRKRQRQMKLDTESIRNQQSIVLSPAASGVRPADLLLIHSEGHGMVIHS